MRLCGPCLDSVFATHGPLWEKADVETEPQHLSVCSACCQEITDEEPHALFCTVYRRGQDREDWFGLYHAQCAFGLVDALHLE